MDQGVTTIWNFNTGFSHLKIWLVYFVSVFIQYTQIMTISNV